MNSSPLSPLAVLLSTAHIFTEHAGFQPTAPYRRKVGPVQYALHWIYAVLEPHILRAFDRLLKIRWVTETRSGRFTLNMLCRLGFFFPHCICVSTEAAERFVDHIFETEGPKGARLAVGPCVCQKASVLISTSGPTMYHRIIIFFPAFLIMCLSGWASSCLHTITGTCGPKKLPRAEHGARDSWCTWVSITSSAPSWPLAAGLSIHKFWGSNLLVRLSTTRGRCSGEVGYRRIGHARYHEGGAASRF
jgi:hypothetical protein